LSGAVQGVFTFYAQGKPLVDDGKVRALAVAAPHRIAGWPDVPTFRELGYDIDFRGFVGLAAPASVWPADFRFGVRSGCRRRPARFPRSSQAVARRLARSRYA
jgi:tripartite-type tricarboxylate transporter receptor subunit TctC